jgi:hypothetical protein
MMGFFEGILGLTVMKYMESHVSSKSTSNREPFREGTNQEPVHEVPNAI